MEIYCDILMVFLGIEFCKKLRISDTFRVKFSSHTHTHTHTHVCVRLEKKLDGSYTRMLRAILNRSWQQHPTRCQLYGHLPPITKTIHARRTRHAGHCWRSKDEIVSDVLLWTPAYGQSKAGRPPRTFIQQLCDDTGCNPEDMPEAMNDHIYQPLRSGRI